ncbi:MAG: methyltransferase domain-containing protein [Planctomycetaceae bacterium]
MSFTKNSAPVQSAEAGYLDRTTKEPRQASEVLRAYDGSTVVIRMLRSAHWGPELMNLGYSHGYFGFGRLINAFRTLSSSQRTLAFRAIGLMEVAAGDAVLDIACGRGGSSFMIRHSTPAAMVHAIDLLDENIHIAHRIFPNDQALTFTQGNAQALQFPDGTFQRVLCCEAAFHFPDRAQFLREAARVLAPGGQLVVVDFVWNSKSHRQHLDHPQTRIVRDIWEWDDLATEEEYHVNSQSAGLEFAKSEDWTRRVTLPLQRRMEVLVWLSHRAWGRRLMSRFKPLFASMNDEDWNQLRIASEAHRFIHDLTQYKAFVFRKPMGDSVL